MGVVVPVFRFDGAMDHAYYRSPRLSFCPLHVGQNDDCLQIVVDAYSIRLHFGHVHCKFFDVDCICVSPIEYHPCNVGKLLPDVFASGLSAPSVMAVTSWWS